MIRYPFPAELLAIPRDRSAVIEASAGTGKTFLIEHLVVDRLLRGDARIDEILVVTFTERATAELIQRVRGLVARLLRHQDGDRAGDPQTGAGPAWALDDVARARLAAAEQGLDGAPISTIHAFCSRVLTEHAFAGGRLLAQQNVDSRTAFAAAFADVLRTRLATDPELAPYLTAWLERDRGSVAQLEGLLFKAHELHAPWGVTFDPDRLAAAADALASEDAAEVDKAVRAALTNASTRKSVLARLEALRAVLARYRSARDIPGLLAASDELADKKLFTFVDERLSEGRDPRVTALRVQLAALAATAVPLATAVAQRLGPPVEQELAARQRAAGRFDFQDMLSLVRDALAGPGGPSLLETLRRRYRLAIIDEFQDTDPVQWEIFRTIFHESGGKNPLYLIGDPKQSIYGFRGADVATYRTACATVAGPDETHRLTRNFRSTPAVIDGYNAILDPEALTPYFTSEVAYRPVSAGRDEADEPEATPPIILFQVTPTSGDVAKLPMRDVRAALTGAIADEIGRLLEAGQAAREIFVLTRTRRESEAIAAALAARGLPHVLYNQEGLYETAEARHVRDLLQAIADPHDPDKRLRAYLSPFFAVPLAELPSAARAGGADPRALRLFEWHGMAGAQELARLYARILDETGVLRRELLMGESLRRATNYQQLFEVLIADAAHAARPIDEVVRWLSARVARLVIPAPEEGNALRVEGDRDAVQIMTSHKAKGLEADVVFLYGGFNGVNADRIRTYVEGERRLAIAGRPRDGAVAEAIKRERDAEDQRLYYVALTRARRRLYLPYSGLTAEEREGSDRPVAEELWKLTGGYRHVNQRLRALLTANHPRFRTIAVPVASGAAPPPSPAAALAAWRPEPALLGEVRPDPALAALRVRRAGTTHTSYSRIKQAQGGYHPPSQLSDEVADPLPALAEDDLPGGARSGILLHALLEQLPLEAAVAEPTLSAWRARADVRVVIEAGLRRHGRETRLYDAAARLTHAALTAPLPVVGGGVLDGLGRAARVARELEFLFPYPDAAGGGDRGFVKGFVDVIFEHDGRTYFGDWKTDRLPAWDAATVDAHVDANYGLQERLYSLALARMLGIDDAEAHEARFGGTVYVFVRGLPHPAAVRGRRPTFADLERWRAELAGTLTAEDEA